MRTGCRMIAIAWVDHLDRATMFAHHFGAEMVHISYMPFKSNPEWFVPVRYLVQWVMAWKVLFSKRPRYVHVTNPPFVAALNVWLYCVLTGSHYIMDTHSPTLFSRRWAWSLPIQRFAARHAAMNIVDQQRFKDLFESWGARATILTKPPGTPTHVPESERIQEAPGIYPVMVVNTFAPDEPVEPVLEAARRMPDVKFYITGKTSIADPALIASPPENVVFTGYLQREAYWKTMCSSRLVIVLTTYPYSLLGGAQDAMVLGTPVILSRQPSLIDYFSKGVVFIDNTADGIVNGIQEAQQDYEVLKQQIQELAVEKRKIWQTNFQVLRNMVGETEFSPSAG